MENMSLATKNTFCRVSKISPTCRWCLWYGIYEDQFWKFDIISQNFLKLLGPFSVGTNHIDARLYIKNNVLDST